MNVLHINQSDIIGGAAIAGYRLHQGLLAQGINSRLIVGAVNIPSDRVVSLPKKHSIENQINRLTWRLGFNHFHSIGSFKISKHSFYQKADVLNFHNLHTSDFNYLAIPLLTENKPTVFTLHDMWSFTGHCAYSYDCDRWKIGCGNCPYPDTYPAIQRDNTHLEWKLKHWIYDCSNLTIVTLSNWLTEQVKQSMLSRFPIHYIPNGIDTEVYQPLDFQWCRSLLGIPDDKKVLMFGAQSLKDIRKGSDLLLKALSSLPNSFKAEILLLILGSDGEALAQASGMATLNLGHLSSDHFKAIVYSAADLFIFPTRADNLPLMLQESMACGTPMVSFKIGGVPDLVRPAITGYLATPEDASDLRQGIVQLLDDPILRDRMSKHCRAIALEEYSLTLQVQRYIELYRQVLQN